MKPDIIYTLPEALSQIAALQQAQADLSGALTQERVVFSRIIQEQALCLEQGKAEKQQLSRWLATGYLLAVLQQKVDLLLRRDRYHLQLFFPKDHLIRGRGRWDSFLRQKSF